MNFIFEDENKDLFFETDKGLYFKAKENPEFQNFIPDFDANIQITSFAAIDKNKLVLGTRCGMHKLTKNTRELDRLFEIFPDPLMLGVIMMSPFSLIRAIYGSENHQDYMYLPILN